MYKERKEGCGKVENCVSVWKKRKMKELIGRKWRCERRKNLNLNAFAVDIQ
jgi:hypothetical protein